MSRIKVRIIGNKKFNKESADIVSTRVKVFLINANNEVLYAKSKLAAFLIGGKVEMGERLKQALSREMREEAGIEIKESDIPEPFLRIEHYVENYFDMNKNAYVEIFYFKILSDLYVSITDAKMTKNEIENQTVISKIALENFNEVINYNLKINSTMSNAIAKELEIAYQALVN